MTTKIWLLASVLLIVFWNLNAVGSVCTKRLLVEIRFECPAFGDSPDSVFCCGKIGNQYCCSNPAMAVVNPAMDFVKSSLFPSEGINVESEDPVGNFTLKNPGTVIVVVAGLLVGFILLLFTICCYCCCCRRRGSPPYKPLVVTGSRPDFALVTPVNDTIGASNNVPV